MRGQFTKVLLSILIAVVIGIAPAAASSTSYIAENGVKLDRPAKRQVDGYITLTGSTVKDKIKLLVLGEDKQVWYDVELQDGSFSEEIWFASLGKFKIQVMVNEYDRKYSNGPSITVENTKKPDKYLIPAKHIESNEDMVISTAKEITADCSSELEKAKAIYNWVIDNISYDYEKLARHNKGQYDNQYGALNTLMTGKGVCYDYATLTAALARSLGIKVKVVDGDLRQGMLKGFHAWNEVYIAELNKWINVDTTLGDTTGEDYFDFENIDESHVIVEYK